MTVDKLLEFFREKNTKAGPGNIDWQAKKDAWIKAIEDLYKTISEQYLAASVADGTVKVSFESKDIAEDYIGEYTVRELILQVGDERVVFSPKGTNIVGASGRIDLIGEMGEKTLVVLPKERWGIVATRTPTLKVQPLDGDTLLAALKDVMRR